MSDYDKIIRESLERKIARVASEQEQRNRRHAALEAEIVTNDRIMSECVTPELRLISKALNEQGIPHRLDLDRNLPTYRKMLTIGNDSGPSQVYLRVERSADVFSVAVYGRGQERRSSADADGLKKVLAVAFEDAVERWNGNSSLRGMRPR